MPYASQILPCTPADSRTDDVPFDRAEEGLARAGGCSLRCLADGGGVLLRRKVRREGEVRETPASGFPQISFSPLCCVAWQNSSPLGPPASELTVVEPPNRARREKLFKHINSLPTVYEILSGKAVNKPKAKAKGAAAGQVSASPTTAFSPISPLPAVCFSGRRRRDARRATSMPTRPL